MSGKDASEKALGKALQRARQAAGLTQQELCHQAKLSYSTLAKIERGAIKTPSVFTVARITTVLGVSLDALLGTVSGTTTKPSQQKRRSKAGVSFLYLDINGCLVHFFHGAFSRIAHEYALQIDQVESAFWHFNDAACRGELSLDEFNQKFAEQLGIEHIDWNTYYLEAVEPVAEMFELVSWAAQQYRIGLLSNIMPSQIESLIAHGLLPQIAYDAIIDSSVIGAIKPEAAIYEAASKAAGVPATEILFVDDSRANLMAAEQHGWRVLWFNDMQAADAVERIRSLLA